MTAISIVSMRSVSKTQADLIYDNRAVFLPWVGCFALPSSFRHGH